MKLREILKGIDYSTNDESLLDKEIKDIKIDHRTVEDGDLYIAIEGRNFDGNLFAEEALRNGASVIVNDKNIYFREGVRVDNSREAYAKMCKNFFGNACDDLKIVAITGTNGKTTTCNIIGDILKMDGKKVGIIGTLGAKYNGKVEETGLTTPDPHVLHSLFAKMKKDGVEYVVMEASAHALALHKLDGINFELGVLTNITEDHLDFFGNMQTYANAKFKLFEAGRTKQGLVCAGKAYSDECLKRAKVPMLTYSFDSIADYEGKVIEKTLNGSRFNCKTECDSLGIMTHLVGQYNLENSLAAVAVCNLLGIDAWSIKKGLSCTLPVEGRFNVIKGFGNRIIIDFAHTPDGLEKVLKTARELSKGRLVVVFGCGGNRDQQKRPIMGNIASILADEVVLTSDNPRYENPYEIIADIKKGIRKNNFKIYEDRKKAIAYALSKYGQGDTIVIAGKGAEKYQEIRGEKHPYNDFDAICEFYKNNTTKNKEKFEDENEL